MSKPEEYWLSTKDEIKIRVWYYPSKNNAAIIIFGGLSGSLGTQTFPVEKLINEGYGILEVDSRACAHPAVPVTLGANELFDGEAALRFLLNREDVEKDKIGVMGFSLGGATAIRLASQHQEVQAIVRDGGYGNLGELFEPPGEAKFPVEFFRSTLITFFHLKTGIDPWQISPIDDIKDIHPRPIMLIFGEEESEYGFRQYDAASEPKTLWIVPGSTHGMNYQTKPGEYEKRLIEFFNQALNTTSK